MPVPIPLKVEKIKQEIEQWYKINIDHFRDQQVSTRYISDRVGEMLYQERRRGRIANYRIMQQNTMLQYWIEAVGKRYLFELVLLHKTNQKAALDAAYDRAMKGI